MSLPRIVAQMAVIGIQVLGKATVRAGRQALRNARASEPAGVSAASATSSNPITQRHKMAIDEACNILNIRPTAMGQTHASFDDTALSQMLKNYEHLKKVNEKTSFYLQSKVERAKGRIEAELQALHKQQNQNAAGKDGPAQS